VCACVRVCVCVCECVCVCATCLSSSSGVLVAVGGFMTNDCLPHRAPKQCYNFMFSCFDKRVKKTEKQTKEGQTDTDRQADRHERQEGQDRQTDRQTDRHTVRAAPGAVLAPGPEAMWKARSGFSSTRTNQIGRASCT